MIKVNEIKTMDEAIKFYNQEFKKIEEIEATNLLKIELLNQLNITMSDIYKSLN